MPLASSSLVLRPPALPMMDGRSPCQAKSSRPFAMASLTAGPAPWRNDHSMRMPSFLNSCSKAPRACAMPTLLPPMKGRLPIPTVATPIRMTLGLSAPCARAGAPPRAKRIERPSATVTSVDSVLFMSVSLFSNRGLAPAHEVRLHASGEAVEQEADQAHEGQAQQHEVHAEL